MSPIDSNEITLAFSANHPDPPARLRWAQNNSCAVEYSPDPDRLDLLPEKVRPFIQSDIPVRFHTRYFRYEIGHSDRHEARKALDVHIQTLKKIQGLGEPVVTVHTGLCPVFPVKNDHIVENLSRLVDLADRMGITVCLENLRKGHGSNPYKILEWAETSGAMITMDIGHAMGCSMVMNQELSAVQMVELFGSRIFEAHVYGWEDSAGHHPIKDLTPIKPVMDSLVRTGCRWWTIELHEPVHAMSTRSLVEEYLKTAYVFCEEILTPDGGREKAWEKYGRI
jgi:sugar phosphate isomerase/epimerase